MVLSYFCPKCNKHFIKLVPCCEMNKEVTECRYCGRKATFDDKDFMDAVIKNIEGTRKEAQEAHKVFQEVHKIAKGA